MQNNKKGFMYKNILIFGHSNIGDVIYDLAVVAPLREHYPQAKISFLTSARCRDIVDGYQGIHEIIVLDRQGKDKSFINRLRFTAGLRKKKFDLVVVLKNSLNYLFLRAPVFWRVGRGPASQNGHPVDRYNKMLRLQGLTTESACFAFGVKDEDLVFREKFLQQKEVFSQHILIGILPLAAWPLKSWPISKWNQLCDVLKKRWGIKVLNLGKLPDNPLGQRIAREISKDIIPADKTTLSQAKALLSRCQMFIGPDSSLLHLASCMGVETIGLYGATPSHRFYPYFHKHNILLAKNKLSCMPCYPGNKPLHCMGQGAQDFGLCMDGIEVEDVAALIQARLHLDNL